MRIKQISFSPKSPLAHVSASFEPVTLVIGDSERGKSLLLNTLSEALFVQTPAGVTFTGHPLSQRGDAFRLRSILTFNGSELRGVKNWDEELRGLLLGRDKISQDLRKTFVQTMGVDGPRPWMDHFHRDLLHLKAKLDETLAQSALSDTHSKALHHKLHRAENSSEDLVPLMVKTRLGREYLDLCRRCSEVRQAVEDNRRSLDPSSAETLAKEVSLMEKAARKKRERLEAWERGAPLSSWDYFQIFSGNVLRFTAGCISLGASFLLVWMGRYMPHLHPLKMGGLVFFACASYLMLSTVFGEIFRRSRGSDASGRHTLMDKEQRRLARLEEELYTKRTAYRKKMETLRRNSCREENAELSRRLEDLSHLLDEHKEKILPLYGSSDPKLIEKELNQGEERLRQADLLDLCHREPEPMDTRPLFELAEDLKALQEKAKDPLIGGRYPEIGHWKAVRDLSSLRSLADELDLLLEKLAKDRAHAEALVKSYRALEKQGEEILFRVFQSEDLRRLVQWIFDGKYKTFDLALDNEGRFHASARTGNDKLVPVEKLSETAALQFYFALKLALAQEIMGEDEGVLLLDESLSLFDTLRTRKFVDVLEIFAKGGWQIVYALKDDRVVYDLFQEKFDSVHIIDLNKGA